MSRSYLLLVRLLAIGLLRGSLLETSLLLLLGLGTILVSKLKELSGSILVEGVRELGDGRRDFQALVEDNLLALEANILGPLDKASQILLGLDILTWIRKRSVIIFTMKGERVKMEAALRRMIPTDTKVLRSRFEEWVLGLLLGFGGTERSWGGLFTGLGFGRLLDGSLRQVSTGQYRVVLPEPGALMPASNSGSTQAPLDIEHGESPMATLPAKAKEVSRHRPRGQIQRDTIRRKVRR